jgi:hypothetical protein
MSLLRKRVAATDEKLKALSEARKASDKDRRQAYSKPKRTVIARSCWSARRPFAAWIGANGTKPTFGK